MPFYAISNLSAVLKYQIRRFFFIFSRNDAVSLLKSAAKGGSRHETKSISTKSDSYWLIKKARLPPGETTLIYMNCLIVWILLTMPMRPSGLFGQAHFAAQKFFWRNFKKSAAFFKNAVLLYYFEGMNDTEIAELFNTSRSTIQYRRTSSFELLKKYLEENADEWDEW